MCKTVFASAPRNRIPQSHYANTGLLNSTPSNPILFHRTTSLIVRGCIRQNKNAAEENAAKLSKSVEALDADLTKISAAFETFSSTPGLKTCSPLQAIENSELHSSVTTVPHVVGFQVEIPCKQGFYLSNGPTSVTCFASGNYCSSDKWPVRKSPLAAENLLDPPLPSLGGGSEHPISGLSGRHPAAF